MIGLVNNRPNDPLKYIEDCLRKVEVSGGTSSLSWDTFITDTSVTLPEIQKKLSGASLQIFRTG